MSAFTHIVTDWAPLVGGLCGFAAFSEMLWRKLVVAPRARKQDRAIAAEIRATRATLGAIRDAR